MARPVTRQKRPHRTGGARDDGLAEQTASRPELAEADEHRETVRANQLLREHHELVAMFHPILAPESARASLRPLPPSRPVPSAQQQSPVVIDDRRRRRGFLMVLAFAVAMLIAASAVAGVGWPPMRYVVYIAWMMPLAELLLLVAGQVHFRTNFREAPQGKFTHLIIQITTVGGEQLRVNEIIKQIRDYSLPMDYQIWVVTEPFASSDYPLADLVLVVPPTFTARSAKKARALEYSRITRMRMGLERGDVKILFNDDDVSLTKSYIERAFIADYDICQGIVTPRTAYAVRPFGHFATSHADDIRTHGCLVYCSVFQGIFRRPFHVHGEGLTVTGDAEGLITWDIPLVASEDLAFGQRAAHEKSLQWGWFHEYAEVTSPWSFRDYFVQRSRWLWGDIHAITHRDVMPLSAALLVTVKYLVGTLCLVGSMVGLYLRATGRIPATSPILSYAKLSILAWAGLFFTCGWIGAGSATSARNHDSRLLAGIVAVLMMPISVSLTFAALVIPLVQGDPRTFRVIRKTRSAR
jgi:Glycosyl transferase family group 2